MPEHYAVRSERVEDHSRVREILTAAFPSEVEANLVEALRATDAVVLSLVAEANRAIVGHILFTRVHIEGTPSLALAPMAVLPSHQRRGVGSALVRRGLERAGELGEKSVVVLGHPEYYPRFGFVPARPFGLRIPWEAPDEAFRVLELVPGALRGISGDVKYAAPFADL